MDVYGPPLPPGFKKCESSDEEQIDSDEQLNSSSFRKLSTEPTAIIGPQCPDFIARKKRSHSRQSSDSDSDGESIPKVKVIEKTHCPSSITIGPVLPPELQRSVNLSDDSDSDMPFGPLPIQSEENEHVYDVIANIEKRAISMRNKLDKGDTPDIEEVKREEWMTVPDTTRKNQLGAISRCLAPGAQKQEPSKHRRHHIHSEKDKKTTEELKKYNKSKRSESLLDLHKKDKKKNKKSSSDPTERKAFDRDEIAVHRFDKDQVNSMVDKAKYLNSRFAPGASHYL